MKNRKLTPLKKETQLNFLIKRKREEDFVLLYHSLWGKECIDLMSLVEEWKNDEGEEEVFSINSWDLPHAFTAFSITRGPALVTCKKGKIHVEDRFSAIRKFFTVGRV